MHFCTEIKEFEVTEKEKIIIRARKYCAYQERCHSEMKQKLADWGVWKKDADEVMAHLISEGFLNEERFAIAFAGGKFRIKKWGRVKIANELRKRQVSDYCIESGLSKIDEDDYTRTLKILLEKKLPKSTRNDPAVKQSAIRFAMSRGFELYLIKECLEKR